MRSLGGGGGGGPAEPPTGARREQREPNGCGPFGMRSIRSREERDRDIHAGCGSYVMRPIRCGLTLCWDRLGQFRR